MSLCNVSAPLNRKWTKIGSVHLQTYLQKIICLSLPASKIKNRKINVIVSEVSRPPKLLEKETEKQNRKKWNLAGQIS